jgi:protein disulfide-isomerase
MNQGSKTSKPGAKMMKKLGIGILAAWMLMQAGAAELSWLTDLPNAKVKAKSENKLVLMDFTGSDWCIWCKRLKQEVLSTPEFIEYANKNLVAVEVDFPRQTPQSEELKKANQALQRAYAIEGYPTIIVLDGEGKKVGTLGYEEGGPKPFIARIEALKNKSPAKS